MNNLTSPLYHPEQPPSDPLPPPDIGPDGPDVPVAPPVDGDEQPDPDLPDIDGEPDLPEEEPPAAGPPGFFDPGKTLADMDEAHKDATRRNQRDWEDSPSQQATNQHFIDMRFGQRKREIGELRDQLGAYLADWLGTPQPSGEPRTQRPPFRVWTMLSHDQRRAVDGFLARNAGASRDFHDRWINAEREGRLAKADVARSPSDSRLAVDPFLIDVDVRENAEQGKAAEEEFKKRLAKERATFESQVRLYAKGVPGYMVVDVFVTGGGVSHVQIVEVKSGDAKLTPNQLEKLTHAVRTQQVYIVRKISGIEPNKTFAEQGIRAIVTVVGGDQEAIKRQFRGVGIEYIPSGGGRGRPGRGMITVFPE
jgi:hypothetical protein